MLQVRMLPTPKLCYNYRYGEIFNQYDISQNIARCLSTDNTVVYLFAHFDCVGSAHIVGMLIQQRITHSLACNFFIPDNTSHTMQHILHSTRVAMQTR